MHAFPDIPLERNLPTRLRVGVGVTPARNGAAVTTIAHRAHPLGFKEQIIPLWDLECLVDDAATFYTDCGSDRPCARTRSAHVPAKPSGPVRPLSNWAGAWESGQTQLLGARHRRGVRPCGRRCADRSRPPGGRDAMHGGQAGRSAGPGTVLGCPGGGCPREARGGSPLSRCRSRPPCASTALTPGVGKTDTRGGAASSGPAAA